jgi:20S proteasome alpha/beta subunit
MTVILALKSAEGLVLATDSQATQQLPGNAAVKMDAVKLLSHDDHILWAGTGSQGADQRVARALADNCEHLAADLSSAEIGSALHFCGNSIQKQSQEAFVRYSPQAQPESWGAIFCGRSEDGFFIAEIDPAGGWQFHPAIGATGSGYAFALLAASSVKHHNVSGRSLEHAKVLAYRAIEMTCNAAATGVGLPVQLGVVTTDGVSILSEAEITGLRETVNVWKQIEVEALGEALGGDGAESEEPNEADDPGLDAPTGPHQEPLADSEPAVEPS